MKSFLRFLRLKYIGRTIWFRKILWSNLFASFGSGSIVNGKILVKKPENVFIGENVKINNGCVLNARDKIIISDNVSISVGVIINTGGLMYSLEEDRKKHSSSKVVIGENAWLASGSIINAGVTIGINSVVASGSVVTKDVPSNVMVAGVPAKIIKQLDTSLLK